MRLIQLLNEKNHFLEKLYSLNENQIDELNTGAFDGIEKFYNQREDLLKILKYVDSEIHKSHRTYKDAALAFDMTQKAEIRECLRVKETYVKKILEQDLTVLGLIDEAKSQIIRELQDIQKSKKALAGYKSPPSP
jgi:ATP-dependent protease Clp ATPase subunit